MKQQPTSAHYIQELYSSLEHYEKTLDEAYQLIQSIEDKELYAKHLNIPRSTFYRKMKDQKFNSDELKSILHMQMHEPLLNY
tara:strand:- start:11244 stop:11489 length:246 start_codon:yes stop_codon:yes gene_type:complete